MSGHQTSVDDRFASAVSDLRGEVDQLTPRPFRPNRSAAPALLALVLLMGIGALGLVAFDRSTDSGGVSVATQPEVPDTAAPDTAVSDNAVSDAEPSATPAATVAPDRVSPALQVTPATEVGLVAQALTRAEQGESYTPIPGVNAWNVDETKILLYRSSAAGGHVLLDPAMPGATPRLLDVTPPDIEQIYWHPLRSSELVYAVDASVVALDVDTETTRVIHEFAGCDQIDSGFGPVPPARDGTLSLICSNGSGQQLVVFDLADETERVRSEPLATGLLDTAALPSPSGDYLVRWNTDGTASVLDRALVETGVVLNLDSNRFVFVTGPDGQEWVAASLFDGDVIGTLVLLPLDGIAAPVVVIGPERGDAYPPSGNLISATGSRVVVSTNGADDGVIAGRVNVFDFGSSLLDPTRLSIAHNSQGRIDYWSNPFVSLSPSGQSVVYSSDGGGDVIDTFAISLESLLDP